MSELQEEVPQRSEPKRANFQRRIIWMAVILIFAWDYWALRERVEDAESEVVNAASAADAAGQTARRLESELEEAKDKIESLEQAARRLRYQ